MRATVNSSKGEAVKHLGMRGFDMGLEMSDAPKAFQEMIDNMYNGSKISLLDLIEEFFYKSYDAPHHIRDRIP